MCMRPVEGLRKRLLPTKSIDIIFEGCISILLIIFHRCNQIRTNLNSSYQNQSHLKRAEKDFNLRVPLLKTSLLIIVPAQVEVIHPSNHLILEEQFPMDTLVMLKFNHNELLKFPIIKRLSMQIIFHQINEYD